MADDGKIAVVGAGVVGLCTALELTRQGKEVRLYDNEAPGSQASFGNAAYLATEYLDPLASREHILAAIRLAFSSRAAFKVTPDHWFGFMPWSLRFLREALPARHAHNTRAITCLNNASIEAWRGLLEFAGASEDLRQCGYLRLYENSADIETARNSARAAEKHGFEARLLRGGELKETEPLLSNRIHHALYFPGSMQLGDTYQTCQHLFERFISLGGEFEQRKVEELRPGNKGIELVFQGQRHTCTGLIIAGGAWSRLLLHTLNLKVPLAAERGYHLTLPQARGQLRHMLSSTDRNVVISPLDVGLRIVGFGEFGRLDSAPVNKRYDRLARHLEQLLVDVDPEAPDTQQWMGIRPTLPDSLPVIDLHPEDPRIGMVFGHQHLGVTQAAISARLVSELIINGQPGEAWRSFAEVEGAYRVSRFS